MIKIIKVTGNSLSPFFFPGDYVITYLTPWTIKKLQSGDTIVFNHLDLGTLIKKITSINFRQQWVTVSGTHPDSIDPELIGPVRFQDVIGKVIFHINNPRF